MIDFVDLGNASYQIALARQQDAIGARTATIFAFSPPPIVTLGIRAHGMSIPTEFECLPVDRGGEATYHGPGQIVLFPTLHLPSCRFTVRGWMEFLLQVSQTALADFGVPADWDLRRPGLFTSNGKIGSVGLKIQAGWSRHGLAINVTGELSPFAKIVTCGVRQARMDRVADWHTEVTTSKFGRCWAARFQDALSSSLRIASPRIPLVETGKD